MKYEELKKLKEKNNVANICLFGAGFIGSTWAYDLLYAIGFQIDFYCDNGKKSGIEIRSGIKTISLEELYAMKENVLVFITVTDKYQQSIKEQLEKNGIYSTVRVDYFFMQIFIESLLEMNDKHISEKFKCILDDLEFISRQFEYRMGYRPNLDFPKTFNEKIQWLKLHDRNPQYTQLVDKYEVKKYISDKVGDEYIVPTLGIYDSFDEIDFTKLPKQFVLKCTHDSGSVVICKNKAEFDINSAKEILEKKLKRNYYWVGREWPYKNVKRKIIVEKYMTLSADMIDYKFMCFNGIPKIIFTCTERFEGEGLKVTFFDLNWNKLEFERHYPSSRKKINRPQNFELMIKIARELSKGIPFVRVDFYEIERKVYFGELTFYPGGGMEEFEPKEWDRILGDWIGLPEK